MTEKPFATLKEVSHYSCRCGVLLFLTPPAFLSLFPRSSGFLYPTLLVADTFYSTETR